MWTLNKCFFTMRKSRLNYQALQDQSDCTLSPSDIPQGQCQLLGLQGKLTFRRAITWWWDWRNPKDIPYAKYLPFGCRSVISTLIPCLQNGNAEVWCGRVGVVHGEECLIGVQGLSYLLLPNYHLRFLILVLFPSLRYEEQMWNIIWNIRNLQL